MATSEWLTPSEAGALLGVGPDRVAQLVRQGLLPAMRTPGGHVRIRRDKVEDLANRPDDPPSDGSEEPAQEDDPEPPATPSVTAPPKWENVPPWKRRVREAESDLRVMEFDDQKEQLLETRAKRQAQREQAEADRAAAVAEAERLRKMKSLALSFLPWGVPADVKADVARQLERRVTSDQYPASLTDEHANVLLRAEVERCVRPWRAREARRERVRQDARTREDVIAWAVLHATFRTPPHWDFETKRAFERDVRRTLEEAYEPGMDHDEADDIAFGVLEDWIEGEEEDEDA